MILCSKCSLVSHPLLLQWTLKSKKFRITICTFHSGWKYLHRSKMVQHGYPQLALNIETYKIPPNKARLQIFTKAYPAPSPPTSFEATSNREKIHILAFHWTHCSPKNGARNVWKPSMGPTNLRKTTRAHEKDRSDTKCNSVS